MYNISATVNAVKKLEGLVTVEEELCDLPVLLSVLAGLEDGLEEGLDEGLEEGLEEGFPEGLGDGLDPPVVLWPVVLEPVVD